MHSSKVPRQLGLKGGARRVSRETQPQHTVTKQVEQAQGRAQAGDHPHGTKALHQASVRLVRPLAKGSLTRPMPKAKRTPRPYRSQRRNSANKRRRSPTPSVTTTQRYRALIRRWSSEGLQNRHRRRRLKRRWLNREAGKKSVPPRAWIRRAQLWPWFANNWRPSGYERANWRSSSPISKRNSRPFVRSGCRSGEATQGRS